MTAKKNFRRDTLTSHLGRDPQKHAGLVNVPVYRGSTVLFDDVATYEGRDPDDYKVMRYGIYGTPTTFALEAAVGRRRVDAGAALEIDDRLLRHHELG